MATTAATATKAMFAINHQTMGFKAKTMQGAKRQSPKMMHWTELIHFKLSLPHECIFWA
jgi:hypothetical protein